MNDAIKHIFDFIRLNMVEGLRQLHAIDPGIINARDDRSHYHSVHYWVTSDIDEGSEEMLDLLIEICGRGCVGIKDIYHTTALHLTVRSSYLRTLMLINRHAYIDARDNYGYSPLHYAVLQGQTKIVELLISKGCKINPIGNDLKTPYNIALELELKNIAWLLIQQGATNIEIESDNKE